MTKLKQLELAVDSLTQREYDRFRQWFLERDWAKWDRQIEADSSTGKLVFLLDEARKAKTHGKLKNL
ncbi:hypothetical protein EG829_24920 [bacterium]|nr:hypothetical protein [bacterium]